MPKNRWSKHNFFWSRFWGQNHENRGSGGLGSVLACWFVGRGPKTGVLSRTVFWVWGGFLGLGEVRDLYRKVGDIGGLHFHQVPSKSVPRGAKTSQKTVYLRIPSEQTTCCFLQARTEPSKVQGFDPPETHQVLRGV